MKVTADFFQNVMVTMGYQLRVIRMDLTVTYSNCIYENLYQIPQKEIGKISYTGRHFRDEGKAVEKLLLSIMKSKTNETTSFCQRGDDGTLYYYSMIGCPFCKKKKEIDSVFFFIKDVTQKKVLEGESFQREKLASIGQLASSLAHEIKNPLTGIKLGLDILVKEVGKNDIVLSISDDVERLNQILEQLLDFVRVREKFKKKLNINQCVKNALFLLRKQAEREYINIKTEFSPITPDVIVDENEMKQVIVNIILNAIQSNPKVVTIKTSNYSINDKFGALITIEDDGTGIPEGLQHKINGLFFTTKEYGTGLGLPMSQKIIRENGGSIVFESKEGFGTVFRIYVPIDRLEQ